MHTYQFAEYGRVWQVHARDVVEFCHTVQTDHTIHTHNRTSCKFKICNIFACCLRRIKIPKPKMQITCHKN